MAIDFTLTKEQKELQASAREFAKNVLSDVGKAIMPYDRPEDRFEATKAFYSKLAEAGYVHALVPERYGGSGASNVDLALATEELTAVDINVPTTLIGTALGLEPLQLFGTDEQKMRFLPEFLENSNTNLASFAFTEVSGGSNFDSPDPSTGVQTHARLDGSHWIINGKKQYTTNGAGWEGEGPKLFTVVCRTDLSAPPQESLAIIVVPGDTPGIEVKGYIDTLGHRAVSSPIIHFDNVRVPAENILGNPGDGIKMCRKTFSWTAAMIGAACTGVMRAAFGFTLSFAREERRGGVNPILDHQAVGYILADVKMKIEASRYLTWKACHLLETTDGEADELAIITKTYTSEQCVQAVWDCMRVVGVNSYTDLTPLAGLMQDAMCFPLYDGGNLGVRRRQIHSMLLNPRYDQMASAVGERLLEEPGPDISFLREGLTSHG